MSERGAFACACVCTCVCAPSFSRTSTHIWNEVLATRNDLNVAWVVALHARDYCMGQFAREKRVFGIAL